MQSNLEFTPTSYLRVNKILYTALSIGVAIITIAFLALVEEPNFHMDFEKSIFMMIIPTIAVMGIIMSKTIFSRIVNTAKTNASLKQKLLTYRTALIIGLALGEAPAIIANVAFFMEGNQFYQFFSIICIAFMLTYNPTEKKTIKDLGLTGNELEFFKVKSRMIN